MCESMSNTRAAVRKAKRHYCVSGAGAGFVQTECVSVGPRGHGSAGTGKGGKEDFTQPNMILNPSHQR